MYNILYQLPNIPYAILITIHYFIYTAYYNPHYTSHTK